MDAGEGGEDEKVYRGREGLHVDGVICKWNIMNVMCAMNDNVFKSWLLVSVATMQLQLLCILLDSSPYNALIMFSSLLSVCLFDDEYTRSATLVYTLVLLQNCNSTHGN